ncbi:MAG: TonB-dependent receptor [Nonlabens sp.]|uniref:TonB-dependent receptor n=1 Tax=Nonlabens sp. TaxID=1888209 RepID=UPI003EF91278
MKNKGVVLSAIFIIFSVHHAKAEEKLIELDVVEVIGENIVKDIFETNTSVNVQTEKQLERTADQSIQDVFRRAANVTSTGAGIQSFDFSIRGISTDGVGGAGQEGLSLIIIDGANTTRAQNARGIRSLFDLERVEILRGPQSTNQGKNSLAGAVIIKTKDPTFERETHIRAGYAEFNTYQTAAAHSDKITDDLAYRIVYDRQSTDGFLNNKLRNEDDFAKDRSTTARLKLLYEPIDLPVRALFSYTNFTSDSNNDIQAYDVSEKKFISRQPFKGGMDTDQDLFTLDMVWDINDSWSLQSITTYNDFKSEDLLSNYAVTVPTDDQLWRAGIDQEETIQEFRANYKSDLIDGTMGFYYSDNEEINTRDGIGLVGLATPFGPQDLDIVFFNPTKIETKAIFGEMDYKATEKLTLTAGFRYEKLKFDLLTDGLITLPGAGGFVFQDLTLTGNKDQDVFLPKLAVNYAVTPNQRIGFTYSEGYRAGGVDLDIFGGGGSTEYDPEFTDNYELSYKGKFLNKRLSVNANLFYIDWEDMQTSGSAQIRSGTFNAGKSTVYGGEFETTLYITNATELFFNAGYSKTKFDEYILSGGSSDFSGNEFANAPRFTISAGAYHNIGNARFGIEASHRDKFFDDVTNTFEVDALTTINLSAAYQYKALNIKLYANNVFDDVEQTRSALIVEGQSLGLLTNPRKVGIIGDIKF